MLLLAMMAEHHSSWGHPQDNEVAKPQVKKEKKLLSPGKIRLSLQSGPSDQSYRLHFQ